MKESKNWYTSEYEIRKLKNELHTAKSRQKSNKLQTMIRIAFRLITWGIFIAVLILLCNILFSAIIAKKNNTIPQLYGYQIYRVQTGSMTPTLSIGSIIVAKKPQNPEALNNGDIVTFTSNGRIITHRIIEIVNNGNIKYRTKGDNPDNSPDPELLDPKDINAVFILKIPFT
jgi:signal peptidase